ncbi:MAG TPA: glutamine amidotransferase, partial [Isosphaeraceae bacterium]|nr:glutamine amidotransferase [Isosphaeraceae bacterium]
ALPRIYQKEARLISKPLIYERKPGWVPSISFTSEPITGLPSQMPPITGLVLTSLKENELVEAPLISPLPPGDTYPLLAHWTYGLGRSVAFTSDAGRKWTTAWPNWESYAAFWSQLIRWSMRPVDKGNLTLSVRREEGRIKVVVDALDKDNQFLNFLTIQGNVLDPDMNRRTVELAQTAPGRYEGTIDNAEARGNYFVNLGYRGPENMTGILTSGVSVPYSDEYRELRSNPATLETIASLTNGTVIDWKSRPNGTIDITRTVDSGDVFRRDRSTTPPRSFRDLWPNLLWLAAVLFLFDVAVRRVAPDFDRMRRAVSTQWEKLRGREVAPPTDYMEKLRSRKAEVDTQMERSHAATRFEAPPIPTAPIGEPLLEGALSEEAKQRKANPEARPGLAPGQAQPEVESYTNRLLKAKKKVWEEREKEQGDNP